MTVGLFATCYIVSRLSPVAVIGLVSLNFGGVRFSSHSVCLTSGGCSGFTGSVLNSLPSLFLFLFLCKTCCISVAINGKELAWLKKKMKPNNLAYKSWSSGSARVKNIQHIFDQIRTEEAKYEPTISSLKFLSTTKKIQQNLSVNAY